jgi:hypothetical protein
MHERSLVYRVTKKANPTIRLILAFMMVCRKIRYEQYLHCIPVVLHHPLSMTFLKMVYVKVGAQRHPCMYKMGSFHLISMP